MASTASDAFAGKLKGLQPRHWGIVRGLIKEATNHPELNERERRLGLLAEQLKKAFGGDRKRMRELEGMPEIASYAPRQLFLSENTAEHSIIR
jgi:hypothetical protein